VAAIPPKYRGSEEEKQVQLLENVATLVQKMHEVAAAEEAKRTVEAAEAEQRRRDAEHLQLGPKIVGLVEGGDDEMLEDDSDGGGDECPTQAALVAHTKQTGKQVLSLDDALGGIRTAVNPNSNNYTKIDAFDKRGLYARDIDPRKIIKSHLFKTA
jgi:hypothetical protein